MQTKYIQSSDGTQIAFDIIGQDEKYALRDIVQKEQVRQVDPWRLRISRFSNARAFVKVQDGCDNFCSFCKIPYVRGVPRSRPLDQIIEEVIRLSSHHHEIVLCGTNTTLYGTDNGEKTDLAASFGLRSAWWSRFGRWCEQAPGSV